MAYILHVHIKIKMQKNAYRAHLHYRVPARMQEVLGLNFQTTLLYIVMHISNPNSHEIESREPGVQDYP